jgi:polyphosphate kinase
MDSDGDYEQCRPGPDEAVRDTQAVLMERTREGPVPSERYGDPGNEGHDLLVRPVEDPAATDDARDEAGDDDTEPVELSGDGGTATAPDDGDAPDDRATDDSADDGPTTGDGAAADRPAVFDRHPDRWYVPESEEYPLAVRTVDGDRRYYRTVEGAATRLRREYEAN